MSAHASQAFSIASCTDSEDLPTATVQEDCNGITQNENTTKYIGQRSDFSSTDNLTAAAETS